MSFRMRIGITVMVAAVALLVGVAFYWMALPRSAAAPERSLPEDIKVRLPYCEVGAKGTVAIIKVHVQLRNDSATPARLGPGSFWMIDTEGAPHLDRHAAEKPDAPPLILKHGQTSPEMELEFSLSPSLLARPLVLVIGAAPPGQAAGSPPPTEGIRVQLKDNGAPKGPFLEGEWKKFTGTHW
jgi:hypothetical protein